MHPYRTHTCGELRPAHVGESVRLSGWVHRKRDHGQLLFIDLRDHHGITQIVFQPEQPFFGAAEGVRLESVLTVTGHVVARGAETVNPQLATGAVELVADALVVELPAELLPLQVNAERDYPEETRLRYRFLDLRRESMQKNILLRSKVISSIRRRMEAQGFVEFQTPILTASSPEGARDFLVPSRLHPGKFYALPQAPQQYKQLFMISGFDRYFQIAPCFRDEDARADRSPGEFYQLDLEMAFVEQEDVFRAVEPVMHGVFEELTSWEVTPLPFPRIAYRDAMVKYGSDKPDLRNPIEIADVGEIFRGGGFAVFARALEKGAVVRALPAPGAVGRPRRFFDQMVAYAQSLGAPGLGYIQYAAGEEPKGPVAKFLDPERIAAIKSAASLTDGDAVFFVCDQRPAAERLSGADPHPARRGARPDRRALLPVRLDRRFSHVRMGRGDQISHLLAQPVLDAAGRARGARDQGPLGHPRVPVRHRLQRRRAQLGRDPQPPPRHHGQGVRARGLSGGSPGAALRRHVPGAAFRRPAAWRDRARDRPDRDADREPAEHPRGDGLPARTSRPRSCCWAPPRRSTRSSSRSSTSSSRSPPANSSAGGAGRPLRDRRPPGLAPRGLSPASASGLPAKCRHDSL